jgi:exodeoxyribonuclease III
VTAATAGGGPIQDKPFSIATWNVNSLRVRGEQVIDWLRSHSPDVVALQET